MVKRIYYFLIAMLFAPLLQAQINVFPNFTDFESEATCATSCTTPCVLNGTWRNGVQYGFPAPGSTWIVDVGGTTSSSTGPGIDHTLGTSTGKYVYTETSGCNSVQAHLVSDYLDFSALAAPRISFWYHMFGATMGTMSIDVDTSGAGAWVLDVVSPWTDNIDLWQFRDVSLSAFAGHDSVRIRIRGNTGTSFTSDMAVDDINIYEPQQFDLEATSVSSGGGCGNSVNTPVDILISNVGSDTIHAGDTIYVSFEINSVVTTDTIILANDLLAGATLNYTFVNGGADLSGPSVVTINASVSYTNDTSLGNNTTSVSTFGIPIITSYPYFEDFEAGQNGWVIGGSTSWAYGTPANTIINSAASGTKAFVTGLAGSYNNSENGWVEGPCFDFTNICDPVIELKVWWNAEFSWDGMNITASTDGGTTWTLIGAHLDPFNWYTDNTINGTPGGYQSGWSGRNSSSNGSGGWVTAKHRLNGLGNLGNVKLRINFGSDGSVIDEGVAFDDVRIYNGAWLGEDQLVCGPATLGLNADIGAGTTSYAWSTGDTTNSILAATSGNYAVTVTAGSCVTTNSINVVVFDTNSVVDLGPDTTSCGSYMLDAGNWPGATVVWSTGDTANTIMALNSGTYSVDVITVCGTISDAIVLVVNANPTVDLGADTTACGSLTLDAGNTGSSFAWSTGSTAGTEAVISSGTYAVTVTNASGCTASDDIIVSILPTPAVNLGADQLLCDGASALLDAGNNGVAYVWSDNSTASTLSVSTAGSYSVAVSDSAGCVGMDTVVITTDVSPAASFSFTVGGAGLSYAFTDGSTSGSSYSWDFGDGGSSTSQNPTHNYAASGSFTVTLITTNACGSDTTSQSVMVVGTTNQFASGSVRVFPNPNDGQFKVTFDLGVAEEVVLSVQNLAGQVVYSRDLGLVGGRVQEAVQLHDLPAGMYMLRLQSSNAQSVHILRID